MENVDGISNPHRVNSAPCVSLVVCNDLKNRASAKSSESFDRRILLTALCRVKGLPHMTLNGFRKRF